MDELLALANEIKSEELPEPYRTISENIGVINTLKLARLYQGTGVYLPKLDNSLRRIRDDKIRKEFNGGNYKELAHKFKLTESWVREIINANRNLDQISMFELPEVL